MTVPANNSASLQGSTRVCTQITLKHVPVQRKREINKNEYRTLPKVFLKRRSRLSGAVFRGPFASRGKPLLMGPFQKNPPNKRVVNRDATRVFIPPYFHFVFFSQGVRFFLFFFFCQDPFFAQNNASPVAASPKNVPSIHLKTCSRIRHSLRNNKPTGY